VSGATAGRSFVCTACNQTAHMDADGRAVHNSPTLYGPAHDPVAMAAQWGAVGAV